MEPHLQPQQLLLVEDDRSAARVLCLSLDIAGYEVKHAMTGREALRLADAHPLDGAILDYSLPDTTGREVARKLRELLGADFPIVIVTGNELAPLQRMVADGEIDALIGKPFDIRDVLEALKRH